MLQRLGNTKCFNLIIHNLYRTNLPSGAYPPPPNVPTQYYQMPSAVPPVNLPNFNISGNVKAAPWHKAASSSQATGIRPSYSSATTGSKVNFNVTQVPVLKTATAPGTQKKTNPIPVSINSAGPKTSNVAPKDEWASNIKAYVERAFLSCKSPDQRDKMEHILRVKIKDAIANETMSKINWESEPIPEISSGLPPVKESNIQLNQKKNQAKVKQPAVALNAEDLKRLERAKRFEADQKAFKKQQAQNQLALQNVRIEDNQADVIDWDEYTIVGTCQKLEKPYLRLTSAPDPATVRPLPVLKLALKMLKDKWRSGTDYGYICDQFKSLRQDMTVQRIKSDFTVQVYEIHARIAIEQGDLGEYNQCQTQLKVLYAIGLSGFELEFMAYRLLYLIHCRNKQAINQFMGDLSEEQRDNEAVSHALKVRSAIAVGNYSQLFQLYATAPNMGAYLMDLFIPRERSMTLITMLKAFRPTLSLSYVSKTLAFTSEAECKNWLISEVGDYSFVSNNIIDCKSTLAAIISK